MAAAMSPPGVQRERAPMTTLYRKRLFVNRFNLVMSLATMAFGMFFLLWILGVLFWQGFSAL
jgi:hypothetical protein